MRPGPLTKRTSLSIVVIGLGAVLYQGCSTAPHPIDRFPGYPIGFVERGMASWYGPDFHGNKTANGERYDMYKLTAAHRTLPLGSVAVVHSLTSVREGTGFGPFVGWCPSAWDGRQRNRPGRTPSCGL